MTEIKSTYVLGWKKESSFGNSFTALAAGETACYEFGERNEASQINYRMDQRRFSLNSSRDYDAKSGGEFYLDLKLRFRLMDALPLFFALGTSSDGDDGGVKTHAITGMTPAQDLPSFVTHYEADDVDATSNLDKDIFGCRVNRLALRTEKYGAISVELDALGLDEADGNHITAGVALKPTAVDSVFHFKHCTFTYNSVDQAHLVGFSFSIVNFLEPVHVDRASNAIRAKYIDYKQDRLYQFSMVLYLKNKTLLDKIKAKSEETFSIPIQRTDADDKITITLSNATIESGPLQVPALNDKNLYTLVGHAKACSIAVRDSIANY